MSDDLNVEQRSEEQSGLLLSVDPIAEGSSLNLASPEVDDTDGEDEAGDTDGTDGEDEVGDTDGTDGADTDSTDDADGTD